MTRRLLLLHPSRLDGENRGVYEQHVASMRELFRDSEEWQVHALDLAHPSFPDAALAAELVIVHMLAATEIEAVIRLRRARGLATIFEISDNFLDIGGWLPGRHTLRNPLVRQRILFHASIADAVQVYALGLRDLFAHVHQRVIQLAPWVPLRPHLPRGERFVVGWGGTTSHEEDLAAVAPAVVEFCRRHEDATFAFMGSLEMGERLFGAIPRPQLRMRAFGDHDSYLDFVSTWDAGLAPMRASGFNAARTDTKFATYAACGVAPLLQDCDVYREHGAHALLFRDALELGEVLEGLYADRERARELGLRARAWAERERSPERLRVQRIAAYDPLVTGATGEAMVIDEHPPAIPTDVDGLRTLIAEHPEHAQARVALADALRAAGDEHGALDVLDARPFPPVFAGSAAERQYDLARRIRPERAEAYASRIDSPLVRTRLAHRDSERPVLLRALLEEQPFEYIALASRLRELLDAGSDTAELSDVCLRACMVAPELVPPALRPASLARFLPA